MRSNSISVVGVALIILGLVTFYYDEVRYTSREKVMAVGPLQAGLDTGNLIPMSSLSIGLVLLGGAALVRGWIKKSS
jgi:hypothetical protein